MRVIPTLVLIGLAVAVPAVASNPGEPLDCSDWMSVEPGYTCTVFAPVKGRDLGADGAAGAGAG